MKRQSRWMAVLFAIFLALCGSYQTLSAQTPAESPMAGIYVWQARDVGENTIVLRLKPQGQVFGVYGTFIRLDPNPQDNVLLAITGQYDPATRLLKAVLALPPALRPKDPAQGVVDGAYNALTRSFSLEIKSQRSSTTTSINEVAAYTGTLTYVFGIWQWSAATSSAALVSAPSFSGEFYILHQQPDGTFAGLFSGTTPVDVGTIAGQVTPNGVFFKRTGTSNGQPFEQIWYGQASSNTETIQGGIEQNTPSPWKGEFLARW